ncbi:MAG: hypothetical protein K2N11_02610 [Mucispirillum sp.]|nr:hypothetical protein [Mucispirillum sp.]
MNKQSDFKEENLSSLKLLWQSLPLNLKRFVVVVFIILICSAFFTVFFADDAVSELKLMSEQIDNYVK